MCLVQSDYLATTEIVVVAETTHNDNVVGVLGMRNGAASRTFLVESLWEDSPPWGTKREIDLFDTVEIVLVGVVAANNIRLLVVCADARVITTANVEKRPICGPLLASRVVHTTGFRSRG